MSGKDLGPPKSVETLAESVLVLIKNSGQVERAKAALDDLNTALTAKYATVVGLKSKLAAKAATLDPVWTPCDPRHSVIASAWRRR